MQILYLFVLCFVSWGSPVQANKAVQPKARVMGGLSPLDPSSYSRPELSVITHMSLSLNVDFDKKVLSGISTLNIDALEDIKEVILDVSKLSIKSIEDDKGKKLEFTLDKDIPSFGSKLTIKLPETVSKGTKLKLIIKYSTDPKASALQWLEPAQTSGKKHPYLFSQCQPIHARSILPCQDTPAVKFTYDAEVTAPPQFTVLMSALRGEVNGNVTSFNQPVPLPAYLVAIAVGSLEHRTLGPRSLVWAEKAEIERSAWEFAETEKYLKAAERLCGPYVWTQYDLLVLPPSFPYGGMENPCLTFVTPTLLAGDRSLADVIVHEIMHSWTGNLVTNRNFEHFWLNEGFTVFLERKVGASLIEDQEAAKKIRDFNSILGLQELNETVQSNLGVDNPYTSLVIDLKGPINPDDAYSRVPYEKGSLFLRYIEDLGPYCLTKLVQSNLGVDNPYTSLVIDLKGPINPDDAYSRVPYEKGSLFLRYIEDLVGGAEIFDEFLRSYLNHFARKSLDTDQFKSYLLGYFKDNEQLKSVDWDAWFNRVGMPPVIPEYDTAMTKSVSALVQQVSSHGKISPDDISSFSPQQMINFLQSLLEQPALPVQELQDMGEKYGLVRTQNAEVQYRWLRLSIKSRDIGRLDDVFKFINAQGRMKYVRPVYRDLYAWEAVRERAIQNFLNNEKYMMHVSAYTLRKDLHLNE